LSINIKVELVTVTVVTFSLFFFFNLLSLNIKANNLTSIKILVNFSDRYKLRGNIILEENLVLNYKSLILF